MYLNNNTSHKSGFTLIELMLSMAFLSILLVSIALLTVYLGGLYNHGATMKDVNQSGSEIVSDIERSINNANPSLGLPVIRSYPRGATVSVSVLCTGSVSYVANLGAEFTASPGTLIKYSGSGGSVRLAKVNDPTAQLCLKPDGSLIPNGTQTNSPLTFGPSRTIPVGLTATEMLTSSIPGELSLLIWAFSMPTATVYPTTANPELVKVTFTVGTSNTEDLNGPHTSCDNPVSGKISDWCAINNFEVIAHVTKDL